MNCPSCGAQVPIQELDCTQCGAGVGWWVRSSRGREVGPFTLLQMQERIRQGRLGPLDRVRIGLIGEWVPAPEVLRPTFQVRVPSSAPPTGAHLRRRRGPRPALLLTGAGLILLATATAVVVTRASNPPRPVGADDTCLHNLRSLARGLRAYAEDSGDALPSWERWGAVTFSRAEDPAAFVCPAAPSEPGYAYNAALSGVHVGAVADPGRCALLWDAGALGPFPGLSAYGTAPRHRGGDNWGFVDGHAAWRERAPYAQLGIELRP